MIQSVTKFGLCAAALLLAAVAMPVGAQDEGGHAGAGNGVPNPFVVAPDKVVAIRAGRMFDAAKGVMLQNQVILIRGDRIVEVGAGVAIPAGAEVIDFSDMTVMPGMVDAHVHVNTGGANIAQRTIIGINSAQSDLYAGFTTLLDMDSRGGFHTVDIRDSINAGLIQGPRMQVVGQSLNQRGATYQPDASGNRFYSSKTEDKDVNGPWAARAAVREAKLHGVDFIKIYSTQDFVGQNYMWNPDGTPQVFQSLTLEEVQAIVDESHRLGLKVACHTYLGNGTDPCIVAGVDAPNHLLSLDAAAVRILLQKHLPYVPTVDDLVYLEKRDLALTGGRNSRLAMLEASFKMAHSAGVPIAFGSGATSPEHIPHGKQAGQFEYYIKWGLTPAQALQTSYINAARVLNYNWQTQVGTIEPGKFADIIAVAGDPLADISEMERVKFVMKGGVVVRDDADKAGHP